MGKAKLDYARPPVPTAEELARLDAMSPEEIERNAIADPDNPPMTDEELERVAIARSIQGIRKAQGMSQTVFARTYGIAVARLRDWEQGRFKPDTVAHAYLETIRFEPEAVTRALRKSELAQRVRPT